MIRMLSKPVQPRTMSAMLSIGYFLVGLATVSRQYTFDAISYLSDVENTHLDFFIHPQSITYNFFHSQHLLFSLFVYLFWHFWQLFGYHGSALLPAQLLNLIEGSVTLGITYWVLHSLIAEMRLSLLFSLLLGSSYSFWSNTAMVSDHMASCLMAIIIFHLLMGVTINAAPGHRVAFIGFLNGAAFLMHQVNALLGLMFIFALVSEQGPIGRMLRMFCIYVLTAVLTALVPYLLVGIFVIGNKTLSDFIFWCFYYAMPGVIDVAGHYGTVSFEKLVDLVTSFGASFIGGFYWMNRIFEVRLLQRWGVPLLSLLAFLTFMYVLLRSMGRKHQASPLPVEGKALRLSAAWFASYAVLLFWWWPTYYQLWAVPLTGFVVFVTIYLHRNLREPGATNRPVYRGMVTCIALIVSANSIAVYVPSHDIANNDYYMTTSQIGHVTSPGDIIVVPGDDEYETYIPYFIKRRVASLHAILIEHRNDIGETFEDLEEQMNDTWVLGHDVFVVAELRDTVKTYADVYQLHHLKNEDVAGRFRQYGVHATFKTRSLLLYKLRRPEETQ